MPQRISLGDRAILACRSIYYSLTDPDNRDTFAEREDAIADLRRIVYADNRNSKRKEQNAKKDRPNQ